MASCGGRRSGSRRDLLRDRAGAIGARTMGSAPTISCSSFGVVRCRRRRPARVRVPPPGVLHRASRRDPRPGCRQPRAWPRGRRRGDHRRDRRGAARRQRRPLVPRLCAARPAGDRRGQALDGPRRDRPGPAVDRQLRDRLPRRRPVGLTRPGAAVASVAGLRGHRDARRPRRAHGCPRGAGAAAPGRPRVPHLGRALGCRPVGHRHHVARPGHLRAVPDRAGHRAADRDRLPDRVRRAHPAGGPSSPALATG